MANPLPAFHIPRQRSGRHDRRELYYSLHARCPSPALNKRRRRLAEYTYTQPQSRLDRFKLDLVSATITRRYQPHESVLEPLPRKPASSMRSATFLLGSAAAMAFSGYRYDTLDRFKRNHSKGERCRLHSHIGSDGPSPLGHCEHGSLNYTYDPYLPLDQRNGTGRAGCRQLIVGYTTMQSESPSRFKFWPRSFQGQLRIRPGTIA